MRFHLAQDEISPSQAGSFLIYEQLNLRKNHRIRERTNLIFFQFQPMYYHLGHFSKFVLPGSFRIDMTSSSTINGLEYIAFLLPDGSKCAVILNRSNNDIKITMSIGRGYLNGEIKASSIQTYLWLWWIFEHSDLLTAIWIENGKVGWMLSLGNVNLKSWSQFFNLNDLMFLIMVV